MSNAPTPSTDNAAPTPRNNYAWAYFFVFIIVASVGVTWFMIWFNLSIQLTEDKLDAAWTLWKEKGLKNYNMVYQKRLNDESKIITYGVKVRDGKVTEVKENNKLLEKNERTDDPRIYHSMDNLFRDAQRFVAIDKKEGAKKVYVTAIFDDKNGAMLRYIRRVMGSTERVELHIELEAVE